MEEWNDGTPIAIGGKNGRMSYEPCVLCYAQCAERFAK